MEYYTGLGDDAGDEAAVSGDPAYEFAGFEIVSSVKVALTPPAPAAGR